MSNYLATKEEVREYIPGNQNTDGQGRTSPFSDKVIVNTIKAITERFVQYTGSPLVSGTITDERYDGNGYSILYLNQLPVIEVYSLYDDTDWVFGSDTLFAPAEYYAGKNGVYLKNTTFSVGTKNIKITYSAGYTYVPDDLKHACIQEVLRFLNRNNDIGISSRAKSELSTTFITDAFLPSTISTLDRHIQRKIYS